MGFGAGLKSTKSKRGKQQEPGTVPGMVIIEDSRILVQKPGVSKEKPEMAAIRYDSQP